VYTLAAKEDKELLEKIKAAGTQSNEVDKKAFVAASKDIYADFGKEVAGAQPLIDKANSLR
jgi:TRAP-type transport system periplasmic protein